MIYANLLTFLVAIFVFSIGSVPDSPSVSPLVFCAVTAAVFSGYAFIVHRCFRGAATRSSGGYFRAEKRNTVLALVFFTVLIYGGDLKYYLSFLDIGGTLPSLVNIGGLGVFLLLLCMQWLASRKNYGVVFGKSHSRSSFLAANIKANLPIVLPWIALSIAYDLIALVPHEGIRDLVESSWGDVLFFALFLLLIVTFFPPLVRRLWNCRPMPDSPLKRHLLEFCAGQGFHTEIYIWPLFEGRVLTAAVMGIVPRLRYILLTPALLETMSVAELEAVLAHEIGHVRKRHLLLYIVLIAGFSLLAGVLSEPVMFLLLSRDFVLGLMNTELMRPDTFIGVVGGLPLLVLLLIYFRFVFGYFIRNFERQADLYVFTVLGSCRPLVAAFDKIAWAGGQSREKRNWHHFGLGERIAHLELCEREPQQIARQDRKVNRSLAVYIIAMALSVWLVGKVPTEQLAGNYEAKYVEMVLKRSVQGVDDPAVWYRLLGDLLLNRKLEKKALIAYDKALELEPNEPELLNNLAWLLLTGSDPELRNPTRALMLAQRAVLAKPAPHVLDTLATALWANGMVEEAVRTELEALRGNPDQAPFYRRQLQRFRTETYDRQGPVAE